MNPQAIRHALEEYVARRGGRAPDVWPAVQRQVGAGRPLRDGIHVQPTAARGGLLLPLAALLLLAVAVAALAPGGIGRFLPAAGSYGSAPQAPDSPTTPALPAATAPGVQAADYNALLIRNLAARLGVDEARLNRACTAAWNETVDQAVRDGVLDQDAATKLRTAGQNGLAGLLAPFPTNGKAAPDTARAGADERVSLLLKAAVVAIPQALGLSQADYEAAVQSGQTLIDLAQKYNGSLATLKTTLLAAARQAADVQVSNGAWTPAEADAAYQALDPVLEKFLNSPPQKAQEAGVAANATDYAALLVRNLAGRLSVDEATLNNAFTAAWNETVDQAARDGALDQETSAKLRMAGQAGLAGLLPVFSRKGKDAPDPTMSAADERAGQLFKAALAALPPALGLSQADYEAAVENGQTLNDLAQARNVSLDTLKAALLAAARQAADAQVQIGAWTQAEADAAYQVAGQIVDKFLSRPDQRWPGGSGEEQWAILTDAAYAAGAQLLGISRAALEDAHKQGPTLPALAQAHGVDAEALRTAMLQAARHAADAQVSSGAWTPVQADRLYADFSQMLNEKLFSH